MFMEGREIHYSCNLVIECILNRTSCFNVNCISDKVSNDVLRQIALHTLTRAIRRVNINLQTRLIDQRTLPCRAARWQCCNQAKFKFNCINTGIFTFACDFDSVKT